MSDEPPQTWAVRFTRRAREDARAAWEFYAQASGEAVADLWQQGLEDAAASLARLPSRVPFAPEAALFGPPPVHRLIYRRSPGGPAHHIYFRIFDADLAPLDAPFVRILAIRHAAMSPLTEDEAQAMEDENA